MSVPSCPAAPPPFNFFLFFFVFLFFTHDALSSGKDDGLIFYTDVSNGGIVVRTSVGATPVPLSRFCKLRTSPERRQETGLTGIEAYSFLVTQLDLFAKLCSGRNANALRVITEELEYLSWNETFTGMTDTELPDGTIFFCFSIFFLISIFWYHRPTRCLLRLYFAAVCGRGHEP